MCEDVGCVQQLHGGSAGGASGGRKPDTVAEDDGKGACPPLSRRKHLRRVRTGRGLRPNGLHSLRRIPSPPQVTMFPPPSNHCTNYYFKLLVKKKKKSSTVVLAEESLKIKEIV